jgi:hypothetical protein
MIYLIAESLERADRWLERHRVPPAQARFLWHHEELEGVPDPVVIVVDGLVPPALLAVLEAHQATIIYEPS